MSARVITAYLNSVHYMIFHLQAKCAGADKCTRHTACCLHVTFGRGSQGRAHQTQTKSRVHKRLHALHMTHSASFSNIHSSAGLLSYLSKHSLAGSESTWHAPNFYPFHKQTIQRSFETFRFMYPTQAGLEKKTALNHNSSQICFLHCSHGNKNTCRGLINQLSVKSGFASSQSLRKFLQTAYYVRKQQIGTNKFSVLAYQMETRSKTVRI